MFLVNFNTTDINVHHSNNLLILNKKNFKPTKLDST